MQRHFQEQVTVLVMDMFATRAKLLFSIFGDSKSCFHISSEFAIIGCEFEMIILSLSRGRLGGILLCCCGFSSYIVVSRCFIICVLSPVCPK